MSEREQKLRELIAKWRELAQEAFREAGLDEEFEAGNSAKSFAIDKCADELETLLAEPQPEGVNIEMNVGELDGQSLIDMNNLAVGYLPPKQPASPSLSAVDVERLANKHNTSDKWNINFPAFTSDLNALLGAAKPADNYAEIDRLALVITKAVAEERDRTLEEVARIAEECSSDEIRDEKFRIAQTLRALKSQVSVTGASHDK